MRTSDSSLADDPQRVGERRQHHDGGAVLVVVEDRDVEQLPQPGLDLEAARRRDVLEVDAGEDRCDHLHGPNDLVDVLGVQADRPRVDAGEPLEERGLALHHRKRRSRPEVAETQHRRAVGHDRDGVALDRQATGVLRVGGDRHDTPERRRGCRPSTGRRGCGSGASTAISIVPPRCMRKVRSDTLWTSTPSTPLRASHDLVGVRRCRGRRR